MVDLYSYPKLSEGGGSGVVASILLNHKKLTNWC